MSIAYSIQARKNINHSHQQGFNLIEVLVSIVISATALMGLAGLQISSVNTSNVAYAHLQSMQLISEMADQMYSNTEAAKNGEFDIDPSSEGYLKAFADMGSTPSDSASEIEKIKYYWFQNLDEALPGAKSAIKCTATGKCALKVEYTNVDRAANSTQATLEQIISVQL